MCVQKAQHEITTPGSAGLHIKYELIYVYIWITHWIVPKHINIST